MCLSIIDVLMDRDGLTKPEATSLLNRAANSVYLGEDPIKVLEELGLEEDYLHDLVEWV